jgi:hypothetical protein
MGVSRRQSLLSTRKQLKKLGKPTKLLDKELKPVKLKPGTERLLHIFNDLSEVRQQGYSGPLAINYTEIKAYQELLQEQLSRWEVQTLRFMDTAFLDESYKARKESKA